MFHKNILIFLSLIIHLTSGLKSTDFCILKQKATFNLNFFHFIFSRLKYFNIYLY